MIRNGITHLRTVWISVETITIVFEALQDWEVLLATGVKYLIELGKLITDRPIRIEKNIKIKYDFLLMLINLAGWATLK